MNDEAARQGRSESVLSQLDRTSDDGRAEYRAERSGRLERENEFLRGERKRLEVLLADALRVAVAGTPVSALSLLEQLAGLNGTDLARPAFVVRQERRQVALTRERLLSVLRETTP